MTHADCNSLSRHPCNEYLNIATLQSVKTIPPQPQRTRNSQDSSTWSATWGWRTTRKAWAEYDKFNHCFVRYLGGLLTYVKQFNHKKNYAKAQRCDEISRHYFKKSPTSIPKIRKQIQVRHSTPLPPPRINMSPEGGGGSCLAKFWWRVRGIPCS